MQHGYERHKPDDAEDRVSKHKEHEPAMVLLADADANVWAVVVEAPHTVAALEAVFGTHWPLQLTDSAPHGLMFVASVVHNSDCKGSCSRWTWTVISCHLPGSSMRRTAIGK